MLCWEFWRKLGKWVGGLQNQKWRDELLVVSEVKHLSLALVFIQGKVSHRWCWTLDKLAIAQ